MGLSWLIGGSLQEVLTSIVFLFIKHPYDDGDRVRIGVDDYTVKEIRLLSTVFMDMNGCMVQAPNAVLATKVGDFSLLFLSSWLIIDAKFILNIRRSPQVSFQDVNFVPSKSLTPVPHVFLRCQSPSSLRYSTPRHLIRLRSFVSVCWALSENTTGTSYPNSSSRLKVQIYH